jgi:hypothetical protein
MDRKKLTVLVVCVFAALLGFVGVLVSHDDNKPATKESNAKTLADREVGLVVERDPSLLQKNVSEQDKNTGRLWSLTQPKDSRREFVVDANYEQGDSLKKLTGYTKQSLRESVVANVNIQLPKQYPEYKELTQRDLTVNGFQANETTFEYVTSGVKVRQRLLLLFKNSNTAVYIRAQARASDYSGLNKRYFESIFSSATFE